MVSLTAFMKEFMIDQVHQMVLSIIIDHINLRMNLIYRDKILIVKYEKLKISLKYMVPQ